MHYYNFDIEGYSKRNISIFNTLVKSPQCCRKQAYKLAKSLQGDRGRQQGQCLIWDPLQTTKQGGPGKQSLFSSANKIIQVLNVRVIGILSIEASLGK